MSFRILLHEMQLGELVTVCTIVSFFLVFTIQFFLLSFEVRYQFVHLVA